MALLDFLFGKPAPPPAAPDYAAAAKETAAGNQEAQTRADFANRPTINTPFGQESWSQAAGVDPATGKPVTQWTQNTTLTPDMQEALDAQQGIDMGKSNLALGSMDRLNESYAKPFDWGGMPDRAGSLMGGVGDESRKRVEQGMMDRLRPEQQYQQQALETSLANKGITAGSEAAKRAQQQQGDQFSRDQYNALMAGGQEQMNQFNMALQGSNFQNQNRQQAVAEQTQQRAMPLNEMNAILTGTQVAMPNMPNFNTSQAVQGPNLLGAAQQQYGSAMNSYNAGQQQSAGNTQALGSIASTAAMAF